MLNQVDSSNRFITFHRYGINTNNWRIGFTEAIMGIYKNWGSEEIGYLMPASVLLETEENRGINSNLMWLLDGMCKWEKWTFYGELLIDDFALDRESPPQIAVSLGLGRKFNKFLLNFEYARINRWTGNYCEPIKWWIERDVPIGHSIGSDAHNLLINSYLPFNENSAIELSYNWIEDGGGTAIERLKDWPEDVPCETNFGYFSEVFPSALNITSSGGAKFYYIIQDWMLAEMQIAVNKKMSPIYNSTFSFHLD
jgi:hypothetical protein